MEQEILGLFVRFWESCGFGWTYQGDYVIYCFIIKLRKFFVVVLSMCGMLCLGSCRHPAEYDYRFVAYGCPLEEFNKPGNNFVVSEQQLEVFLRNVKAKQTEKAVKLANELFRINARLTEKYAELFSRYRDGKDENRVDSEAVYAFDVGDDCKLRLTIACASCLVSEFDVCVSNKAAKEVCINADYVTDEEAYQLFKNYCDFYQDDYSYPALRCPEYKPRGLKPIGDYGITSFTFRKRVRTIWLMNENIIPAGAEYEFLMDDLTGRILHKNIVACAVACSWLHPNPINDISKRREAMAEIAYLNEAGNPTFIVKAADIPGYEKAPLDSDMERAIVAPFSVVHKNESCITYAAYTYSLLGGRVRRYTFSFDKGRIVGATCLDIDSGIGSAEYIL